MERPPTTVPCSAMCKPAKYCIAFFGLTGLGILLVYGLTQLTAQPSPASLQRPPRASVRTTSGYVEGLLKTTASGRRFHSFLGLPYAQPPLGPLRFQDPVLPPPEWESTLAATRAREVCLVVQRAAEAGYVGAEDCLYLDVHTPQLEGSAAVLVWLGDGSFGIRDAVPRRLRVDRLVDKGVVVVTVEYRRGVLGFLGTDLTGNHGLKDQSAALRWVRANIAAFGGDPARVALAGVGAGAASVGFHLLAPLSKGLFSRAIAMGGSPLNPWAFNVFPAGSVLSEVLRRDDLSNSSQVADYLRTLSVSELVATVSEIHQGWDPVLPQFFAPSIEPASSAEFLTATPWRVLEQGLPNAVPFLTGGTSAEGKQLLKATRRSVLEQDLVLALNPSLSRSSGSHRRRAAQLVRSFYFGDDAITTAAAEDVLNLLTDMHYLEGIDRMARSVAALSPYPVYYYHYTRERNSTQDGTGLPGAMHGEDAYAVLYSLDDDQESGGETETKINDVWLSMLIDFIKTGRAAASGSASWSPYTAEDPAYLEVGSGLRVRRALLPARLDFWNSLLDRPGPPQV